MKKILALVLAMVMVFALCACGGGGKTAAPASGGDDFADWKAYIKEYVKAGAPTEELGQALMAEVDAAGTAEEMEAIQGLAVMFSDVGVLRFNDWVAAGKPAADTSNMGTPPSTGEPSGEAS